MDLRDLAGANGLGLDMLMNKNKTSVDGMSQASRSPPASVSGSRPKPFGGPSAAGGFGGGNNTSGGFGGGMGSGMFSRPAAPSIRSVRLTPSGGRSEATTEDTESVTLSDGGDDASEPEQRFQSGFDRFRKQSDTFSLQEQHQFSHGGGRRTHDDVLAAKREIIYQMERLEKRGVKVPRKFTLASDLDEMQLEYDRLKRDRETDLSIAFQKKVILAGATGLEFLNTRFDPIGAQLDGWSEQLHGEMNDYDEVLEQLAVKYAGKSQVPPEIKLLMMLSGSAFTYHLSKTYFKNLPGLEQILKNNPDLMRQFAGAAMSTHAQNATENGDRGTAHTANLFGSLFGSKPAPASSPPPTSQPQGSRMRGPTNVDELLQELNMTADAAQPPPRSPVPQSIEVLSMSGDGDIGDRDDEDSIDNLLNTSAGAYAFNL
jgi:hypothetical protein